MPRAVAYASPHVPTAPVGDLLRDWRQRRRLSQLDLALEAGVSTRHLSFVETGRAKPSPEMVLHLADELEVPLRERNRLLLAAGYAPVYEERALDEPEMQPVHDAIQLVLDGHDPYPAITVDRGWALVAHNRAAGLMMAGLPEDLLAPPANVLRASLHPDGLAPRIANLGQWKAHLLQRLAREAAVTGDPALRTLYAELDAYPAPEEPTAGGRGERRRRPAAAARPRRRAALLQHRHDVRHAGRHHRRGALDRVVLPGRPRDRRLAAARGRLGGRRGDPGARREHDRAVLLHVRQRPLADRGDRVVALGRGRARRAPPGSARRSRAGRRSRRRPTGRPGRSRRSRPRARRSPRRRGAPRSCPGAPTRTGRARPDRGARGGRARRARTPGSRPTGSRPGAPTPRARPARRACSTRRVSRSAASPSAISM